MVLISPDNPNLIILYLGIAIYVFYWILSCILTFPWNIIMVSNEFSTRFKNKVNTLGKTGLILVEPGNAIEKLILPAQKTHIFQQTGALSQLNTIFSRQSSNLRSKSPIHSLSHVNTASFHYRLPGIDQSKLIREENKSSKSKSPIQARLELLNTYKERSFLNNLQVKLPHLRSRIQKKISFINK